MLIFKMLILSKLQNSRLVQTSPLYSGLSPLNSGLKPLNSGLNPLYSGLSPLNSGLNPLYSGLNPLNSGLKLLNSGLNPLYSGLSPLNSGLFSTELSGKFRSILDKPVLFWTNFCKILLVPYSALFWKNRSILD